jgi:hypothetical protein
MPRGRTVHHGGGGIWEMVDDVLEAVRKIEARLAP